MICPGSDLDCDNPGCRHGGCQGRPPQRLRSNLVVTINAMAAEVLKPREPALAGPLSGAGLASPLTVRLRLTSRRNVRSS